MQISKVLAEPFGQPITTMHLSRLALSFLIAFCLYYIVRHYLLPVLFAREDVEPERQRTLIRWFSMLLVLTLIIFGLQSLDQDKLLFEDADYSIHISTIVVGFIILLIARFLDWYIAKVLLHRYYLRRSETPSERAIPSEADPESRASRIVKYILYTIAAIILLRAMDLNISLFEVQTDAGPFDFRLTGILSVVLILLVARLIAWIFTQLVLHSYYQQRQIDTGRRFAVNQLITYFIYVIAIFLAIDNLGIEMTVLWGGIAALLVGVGLGLQEIFRDLISGIILLFERTVEVGDVIELEEGGGQVRKIGIRTSLVHQRTDTIAIVPNSRLISSQVVNWSHTNRQARFSVQVGVAYGSDPQVVRSLMLKATSDHTLVEKFPNPFVRFTDFADSALAFEVFFWSKQFMSIEDVKSDLRFEINELFLKHNISIPFPQRDVWFRNSAE